MVGFSGACRGTSGGELRRYKEGRITKPDSRLGREVLGICELMPRNEVSGGIYTPTPIISHQFKTVPGGVCTGVRRVWGMRGPASAGLPSGKDEGTGWWKSGQPC